MAHVTETWTYGGMRYGSGKRYHAWILPDGSDRLWKHTGSFAVGHTYSVVAEYEGDRASMIGTPSWDGDKVDDDTMLELSAKDTAAKAKYDADRAEKRAREDSPIQTMIDDMVNAISRVPANQRVAMAGYVTSQINRRIWAH